MKIRFFSFKIILVYFICSSSTIFAQTYYQFPHIPIEHTHPSSSIYRICWAYATVRAFQEKGHSHNDCNAATAGGITRSTIQNNQFFHHYSSWSLSGVQAGDIIEFMEGVGDHAAFVANKYGSSNNTIILDQLDEQQEKTGYTLQQTIDGYQGEKGSLTARGNPTGYYRLQPLFDLKLQNIMGNSENGGKVKIKYNSNEYVSPHTFEDFHWYTYQTLECIMDTRTHDGYTQKFIKWTKGVTEWTETNQEITINWNIPGTAGIYTAYYSNLYNITFRNKFIGVSGNPGIIKVGGSTEDSPFIESVIDGNDIQGESISQTYNGIEYTFDEWYDGTQTASRTETPSGHDTFTAEYTGKPLSLHNNYNLGFDSSMDIGDPIELVWDEHDNDNVKYEIWRKVKHNGVMGSPSKIATKNHGTTSYTDYDYCLTEGYTDDLLYYDVRAYYTTEETYADEDWIDVYGEMFAKRGIQFTQDIIPEDFSIINYPNPFNPSTTISFSLIEDSYVTLKVYNISGQEVSSLAAGKLRAGVYKYGWNGKNVNGSPVAGGMYIAKLLIKPKYGERILLTRKMLLTK